ncbi:NAD(P)/FAD-dependent oxidoreductase [Notoacmeibacter sp. MSK16QG-6]|uniref:NAD(P)/FAD-dependent oxidoreductase n=1 Tax=Notoacmeibacter sp. MSK16QG-6 TaxID=2957982 RepID=UPI00209C8165|nr:FAD-dependent oxidoreductase [Notoacmeibacter sp. MSK16QG-6]MCP1198085.1 FAD-dependent oxidoreductase [Notoacmeibacter sp. MSK16QG-6]
MSDAQIIVIVGAGQAGAQVAASLRQEGFSGKIVMFGDEPGLPYQRPPLSKTYMKEGNPDRLLIRNQAFFDDNDIVIRSEVRVAAIDRDAKTVILADGERQPYDHLVLATGAINRTLPIPGIDLAGVLELRTLAHAEDIRGRIGAARHIAIIGGGFIGLEFAAMARGLGTDVTVLELADRVMARAVAPETSAYFDEFHRSIGVDLRLQTGVKEIIDRGDGHAGGVLLDDGDRLDADLVLVAAGVAARDELAREAGLPVDNGIVVDPMLQTADPAISAIGDCASFIHPLADGRMRIESVQNATDQARAVATRLAAEASDNDHPPYSGFPWFWSDQGDRKLQIAGLTAKADERVVRRNNRGGILVHCLKDGRYVGLETVNASGDHLMARRLLSAGIELDRSSLEAADYDLKSFKDRLT